MWSTHADQQALIAGEDDRRRAAPGHGLPEIGVYVNDDVPDKLGYYLRSEVGVESEGCDSSAVQS